MKSAAIVAVASLLGGALASPFPIRRSLPDPYPTFELIANLTNPILASMPNVEKIMLALPANSTQKQQQAAINKMEDALTPTFAPVGIALSTASDLGDLHYNSTTSAQSITNEFAKGLWALNDAAPYTVKALGEKQASEAWQSLAIPFNSLIQQLNKTDHTLISSLKAQIAKKGITLSPALKLTFLS